MTFAVEGDIRKSKAKKRKMKGKNNKKKEKESKNRKDIEKEILTWKQNSMYRHKCMMNSVF